MSTNDSMETVHQKKKRLIEEAKDLYYDKDKGWKGKDYIVFDPELGEEMWRTVPSFPNYEASNYGRIRHKTKKDNKPIGTIDLINLDQDLHWRVIFKAKGYKKGSVARYSRRIVAETWFQNFKPSYIIKSKDHPLENKITQIRLCVKRWAYTDVEAKAYVEGEVYTKGN